MRYLPFFLILPFALFGQGKVGPKGFINIEPNSDNFERVMTYVNPSMTELDTMIQLGRFYDLRSKDTALLIIEKIIFHTKDLKDREGQNKYAKALSTKGAALQEDGLETICIDRVDGFY